MTVEARKNNIINKIRYVNENWLLKSIEKLLSDIELQEDSSSSPQIEKDEKNYAFYVGNIEEKLDLEKLKKERPLKKLDAEEFAKMADSLEWDQSIEELLEDLK